MTRLAVALLLAISACSQSVAQLQTVPISAGETKYFRAPVDTVVQAVRDAIPDAGLQLQSDTVLAGARVLVAASSFIPFQGRGDLVRIVVQPDSTGFVAVHVHSISKSTMDDPIKEWGDPVFTRLSQRLAPAPIADSSRVLARATLSGIRPGRIVRLSGAGLSRRVGPIFGVWKDGLVLGVVRQDTLPIARIDSVWVRRSYARTGLVVGGALGLLVMELAPSCTVRLGGGQVDCRRHDQVAAAGLGVMLGSIVIGSAVHRWSLRFP